MRPSQPNAAIEDALVARHILQRLGEGGQPPQHGVRRINVGNESYLKVLEHEYFDYHLRFGASFKLVQGYFGGGKTHFLYCVRELAWDRGFATAVVELSPNECPYDDSFKVYQAVVRRIGQRPRTALGSPSYGLPDLLRNLMDDRVDAALQTPSVPDVDAAREAVLGWLRTTVARAACESHSYRRAIVEFAAAFLEGRFEDEQRLEAWLTGESIPASELRELGVYEDIGKSNGFIMLRCLTQMIVGLELPGTVLLFDEVDRNLSVSVKRSQIIGDNLRQVIDLCGRHQLPNTLFMYAVPPEFMRNVVPDYPALYQRLKSPVPLSVRSPQAVLIDLERLDLEPAELLSTLGDKLVGVFESARDCTFDRTLQSANARALANACVYSYFEVNHRRLFVKTWVDFLHRQLVDGELELDPNAATDLVLSGYDALAQTPAQDDFSDF
ncbi:BREX system ATP-binding domain-containing protein [Lujinxingia vulgaris]|nr:BREX system ATP-binding domain-containing protein [Lujinxingia vulgaris]